MTVAAFSRSGSLLGHTDGQASTVTRLRSRFRFENYYDGPHGTRLAEPRGRVSYSKLLSPRSSVNVGDFCVLARRDRTYNGRASQASLPLVRPDTAPIYIELPVAARTDGHHIFAPMLVDLRIAKLVNLIADAALVKRPTSCLKMSLEVLQSIKRRHIVAWCKQIFADLV